MAAWKEEGYTDENDISAQHKKKKEKTRLSK
jgi:hypothetical protein